MIMKNKKYTLFCLSAALIGSAVVSCGSGETTETHALETTMTSAVTETQEITPDLPEVDYDGYTYRILAQEDDYSRICADEETGEIVNDALFKANLEVSELLNIQFENIVCGVMDHSVAKNHIMADDDSYDISYLQDCGTANMALEDLLLNVNEMEYVNTDAEWWPKHTVDSLTLNGKMYHFSNFSSYFSMIRTKAIFFNSDLIDSYDLENPYDLVRAGTWTIDQISKMTRDTYSDVNGNGKQDVGDIFGFAFTAFPYAVLESFGIEAYEKTPGSADLKLSLNNDRTFLLVDKLYNWLYTDGTGIWCKLSEDSQPEESRAMFASGTAVFALDNIGLMAPELAESDVNYGIVPIPKIDETVKEYYGGCNDRLFAVPVTARDPERTGVIIEAMAYAGYKYNVPAYCETTLKTRYATDEDCVEMLNLIFDNQVLSFSYLFANSVPKGMQYRLLFDTIQNNNLASYYAKNEKKELEFMEKLSEYYS